MCQGDLKGSLATIDEWRIAFGAACGNSSAKAIDPISGIEDIIVRQGQNQ